MGKLKFIEIFSYCNRNVAVLFCFWPFLTRLKLVLSAANSDLKPKHAIELLPFSRIRFDISQLTAPTAMHYQIM